MPSSPPAASHWRFLWLGVLAHGLWGSYPVLAKVAMAEVPKFSLLFLASFATMLVGLGLMHWREHLSLASALYMLRRERVLWVLAVVVVIRSVSNLLSIDLTRAIWVQLINILTPFAVALLGVLFFDQAIPRYTFRGLLLSGAGAVLMLVEDWSRVLAAITPRDALGLATAAVSTLALALYFQLVRRSSVRLAGSGAAHGMILFQQALAMSCAFLALSLAAGEEWGAWAVASPRGWTAAMGVIWMAQVGGNAIQVVALGGANPALVSSLMPLRLVSALALAWLALGERLASPTQWAGATLVIATVTAYLWLQRDS